MLRNFTLVYTAGYHRSIEECLICHHIHGPFVAKAKAFQQVCHSQLLVSIIHDWVFSKQFAIICFTLSAISNTITRTPGIWCRWSVNRSDYMLQSFSVWILKGRQSITASSNDLFYLTVCSKYLVSLQVTLSNDDSEIGLFASWFLEIKNRASMAVVCPDSMSFVTDKSRETTTKSQWLNLAKAYQVIQ